MEEQGMPNQSPRSWLASKDRTQILENRCAGKAVGDWLQLWRQHRNRIGDRSKGLDEKWHGAQARFSATCPQRMISAVEPLPRNQPNNMSLPRNGTRAKPDAVRWQGLYPLAGPFAAAIHGPPRALGRRFTRLFAVTRSALWA